MNGQFKVSWSQAFPETGQLVPVPFTRHFDNFHDAESVAIVMQHGKHVSDVDLSGAPAPVWMKLEIPVGV